MSIAVKASLKLKPTASKLKAIKPKGGPTAEQREWLKKLGTIPAPAAADKDDKDDVDTRKIGVAGAKEGLVGFGLEDIPAIIPKGAAALLGPLSATCLINNNSGEDLFLDPKSREDGQDTDKLGLSSGEYEEFPPSKIKAEDQGSKFKVVNVPVDLILVELRFKGCTGRVRYFIGADKKTTWTLFFDNPRRPGGNEATAVVEGANAAKFEKSETKAGGGKDAKFLFVLQPKGGSGPGPEPKPAPAANVPSSCQITVNNKTQQELILTDQGHDRGDFMTLPAQSIPAGGSISFASVETPNAKDPNDQGCKGFLVWEVGSPMAAIWRIEWDNPEQQKNTTKTTVDPQTAGFRSLDQIGQGEENVPVVFTISGGGEGPDPKPKEELAFNPPTESKQPTLRKGNKSKDGWVEYLQAMLNAKLEINLEPNGEFDSATHKAVLDFQKKNNLQVDGTVGNQTWAALRNATAEKPSTDGRKPNTFVEEGAEARWTVENDLNNRYLKDPDELTLAIDSVGDASIDDFEATVRITPPGAKAKVVKVKLGPPQERKLKAAAGRFHVVRLKNFRKTFKSADPKAKVTEYLVEAFLPQELGGDLYKGNVREG